MRMHVLLMSLLLGLPVAHQAAASPPAGSRLERIKADQVVRVCIWPDYYGITYRNPKTLQLSGIEIDMANELGKELGARVDFIDSSFARLIDDLTADRCDIAMFAIGITPARAEKLSFSPPHLTSDIYAIATRTNRRISGGLEGLHPAPKSAFGRAVAYTLEQWPWLCNYLLDGRLEISNNLAERSVKPADEIQANGGDGFAGAADGGQDFLHFQGLSRCEILGVRPAPEAYAGRDNAVRR